MAYSEIKMVCSHCGKEFDAKVYTSVDVAAQPELKALVMSGQLFLHECPHCGKLNLTKTAMFYHDPEQKVLICLTDQAISAPEGLEGYTCRLVGDAGSLIEKVKIFDSGLDDIAVELCKQVTRMEAGKDMDLKFVGIGGADGELTLTYPENGQMQMLSLGYNVYRDCLGILSRNPAMTEKAAGLSKVDGSFITQFFA